jgi:outer membrane protein assembly factor BamB
MRQFSMRALSLASLAALAACQSGGLAGTPPAGPSSSLARAMTSPTATVNWRQFRFDDNHTGVNPNETMLNKQNVPKLQLIWQAQLGGLVDFSSPAVVNGVVYIGSSEGRLWAYPSTGCGQALCTQPLWSSVSMGQIIDSPTVAKGFVYVGSQTSASSNDGKLDVFSATGCGKQVCSPVWQGIAGTDSILESSPAVANNRVFIGSYDGKLYVFNANGCGSSTCAPLWTAATGGSIESTPTVVGSTVYIGSDDGKLYAFKSKGCGSPSCGPVWTGTLNGPAFYSSPAVSGGVVYIAGQHALAAFSAMGCGGSNCAPLWQAANSGDFFDGSPAVAKGRVYIGVENGVDVYAAAGCGQATCNPLWIDFGSGFQAAVLSSPTIANGVVYVGRNTAEVLAWRQGSCHKKSCTNIWSGATNDEIVSSSPTVVNGHLYIGSADKNSPSDIQGRLYVFALPPSRK